jgi:L-threonylcarbamoyladenylate synthase
VDLILDGGACAIGVESTIVNLTGSEPAILRPGGVSKEQLERVLGQPISIDETPRLRAPGLMPTHYAPRAGVVLTDEANIGARAAVEHAKGLRVAVIASGIPGVGPEIAFFPVPEDPAAFAHVLYATLREIDLRGFDVVVAALPPSRGLGLAVRDRLTRAAKR